MTFLDSPLCKRAIAVSTLAALSFLVSCSDNKVSQCNKLIKVANEAVSAVQNVTQTATPDNVAAMSQIATAADKAKADMQGLQIGDEQLKGFQTRFISMYTDTGKATRDLVAAAGAKDAAAAQTAFDALKTATDQEGPLVNQVNTYCTTN
ncbi:MAG: hypothetical protein HY785_06210 [Oscillatoriophycideae cyanobacterium NC_groundwater_1537_Pr4_S-0.65um_50_18]|nr:hypothetical protein [Oscillatoriophycideae cyanobacterium NC_groundwater_1537_Pr4_S-0.65um_50_18]